MSVCLIPPYNPLLYSKTGVYKGLPYFLIFALKIYCGYSLEPHEAVVPTIYVLSKNMKKSKNVT